MKKEYIFIKQDLYSKTKEKEEKELKRLIEFAKTPEGEMYFKNQLKRGKIENK